MLILRLSFILLQLLVGKGDIVSVLQKSINSNNEITGSSSLPMIEAQS